MREKSIKNLLLSLLLMIFAFGLSGCTEDAKPADKPAKQVEQQEKTQSFVVYRLPSPEQEYLLPEKWEIKDNGKPVYENALRTLVEVKPHDNTLENVFPQGTKLLGLTVTAGGLAEVNLSGEINNLGGGSLREMMLTGSVANTLTEFPEIKKVKILVEGKSVETLKGHMDLSDPLERDTSIIKK